MGHYAVIEEDNSVSTVITFDGEDGVESEAELSKDFGKKVLRTSYNTRGNKHTNPAKTPFRGNFASGCNYDPVNDVFIPRKPYESWVLNSTTYLWEAPVPHGDPEYGMWYWSEIGEVPFKQGWNLIEHKPTE